MIHVENKHLNPDGSGHLATAWAMHLVFAWPNGEPLAADDQSVIVDHCVASADTGIVSLDLEAAEDIPFMYLNLDVETTPADLADVDQQLETETALAYKWQEAALAKGVVATLGALTRVGIPPENVHLQAAHLVTNERLERDRNEPDAPDMLFVEHRRYDASDVAPDVFYKEQAQFIELTELLAA